ncbi:MAG: hypothetical protein IJZ36_00385, partial [Bacilli bacterium]|nr:hypothetical protein [Bacilli bacterium]
MFCIMVLMEFFRNNKKISENVVNMNIDTSLAISLHIPFSEYKGMTYKKISRVEFNDLLFKDSILIIT